jgi:PAS domain S-box-containing protein
VADKGSGLTPVPSPPDAAGVEGEASEDILSSEGRLSLFVDAVRDYAIFMLDSSGVVTSWNAGAQRMKGYAADEIVGKHFRTFYTADAVASRHPEHELEIAAAEGRYEEEGWRVRKDGTQFYASVVITAVRSRSGELLGFGKVTRDVTERRLAEEALLRSKFELETRVRERTHQLERTNEKLEEAYEEAQHAIRMREEVLAVVSHDLRNPLGAIQMAAALLLLRLGGDARARRQVETIHRSATRMEHLLGDLLDMASIQAGRLSLERRPENADQILAEVMEAHEPGARERGLQLVRQCDIGDARLDCDRDRVLQVIGNLVGNAIKLCQAGDSIAMTCVAAGREVLFAVADTGPGIPEAELPHLFEPYWSAERHAKKGTGLGLYISKGIVEAHGGRLWAESRQGEGATFYFTLPTAPAQPVKSSR